MIIAATFVLLAGLLLWLLTAARGLWQIKLALILVVPAVSFALYHALGTYRGWPTRDGLPVHAIFVAGIVNEPDLLTHDPGSIYVWLVPEGTAAGLLDYHPGDAEPRAYHLPYSRPLHKKVLAATAAEGTGSTIALGRSNGHQGGVDGQHIPKGDIRFYRLPPVQAPHKGP